MIFRVRNWCLALGLLALSVSSCARPTPRPNILVITIDTLRADRLGCYGNENRLTPHLDELAKQGLVFTHATSPRAKTTPSIVSILSGLYPKDHGVRDLSIPLSREVAILPERLRARGYRAGAIVGNWVLADERSGLARGFDLWVEDLPDIGGAPPFEVPERKARSITDAALVALGLETIPARSEPGPHRALAAGGQPWFLWLHYMDPHGPYDPAQDLVQPLEPSLVEDEVRALPADAHPFLIAEQNVPPAARTDAGIDAAATRAHYDGEVRAVDAQIGRLLRQLDEQGLLKDTIVVVTADHGESLGEHNYWFEHGLYAYQVTVHVPLIVCLPPSHEHHATGRRRANVSLADLAPTLLDLVGAPSLPRRGRPCGRSRRDLFATDRTDGQPVFSERIDRSEKLQTTQVEAVQIGDWKLSFGYAGTTRAEIGSEREWTVVRRELFDLTHDPYETLNLADDPPGEAPLHELESALLEFVASDTAFATIAEDLQRQREALERADPEALRILDALGY